jgi:hypothetical protein
MPSPIFRVPKGKGGNRAKYRNRGRPAKIDACTGERYYTDEECEFLKAIQAYRDRTGIHFPSWCEALYVLKQLGYSKR